ncbi:hypothetical protein J7I91_16015 [Pseudomonas sp. ISL-84]|nr:hypothetical protein [Pseudomonas sp. ISL-84]
MTIPSVWLAVLLALLITALLYRYLSSKKIEEWYWNSFFLYFLVWKLSYILFHFKMVIEMPLSIVYFNGSTEGHFLALASLSVYLLYKVSKKYPSAHQDALQLFPLFFISFEGIKYALISSTLAAIAHLLLLICYVVFQTISSAKSNKGADSSISFNRAISKKKKEILSLQAFALMMLSELLVVSFFQPIISLEILTFSWLAITVYTLSILDHKKRSAKPTS